MSADEFKMQRIHNAMENTFDDDLQILLLANCDGIPVISEMRHTSPELARFLSAMIATMSCIGINIAKQVAMGDPQDIRIELELGTMIIKTLQNHFTLGVLMKKGQSNIISNDRWTRFLQRIEHILFEEDAMTKNDLKKTVLY